MEESAWMALESISAPALLDLVAKIVRSFVLLVKLVTSAVMI